MSIVTPSITYYPDPTKGRPVFNGYIYIGEPDLDPQIPANQKQASLKLEDGTTIPIGQPIRTGPGGVVTHNGSYAVVVADGDYSVKVLNSEMSQVYYVPSNSGIFDASQISIIVNGLQRTSVQSYLDNKEVADYAAVRALPVEQLVVGDKIWVQGFPDAWEKKAGWAALGAADSGWYIVPSSNTDDSYYESTSAIPNVLIYGADPTGVVDSSSAFASAFADHKIVLAPEGSFRANTGVTIPKGCTLIGYNLTGPDGSYDQANFGDATRLFKDSSSSDGPLIAMGDNAGLSGVFLDHRKSGGATDGIIYFPGDQYNRYCTVSNVHIQGLRTGDTGGTTTCYGIKLEGRTSSPFVSYFNRFDNIQVHQCDVCVFLANQCNANNFSNIQTKESHIHYELNGGVGEALENVFTCLGLFSISGSISPDPIGFKLVEANKNYFGPYTTEMFGQEFDVDHTTCNDNKFNGISNEPVPTIARGQVDDRYARPSNVEQKSRMLIVDYAQSNPYNVGSALSWSQVFEIDGGADGLPQQNNNTGTITAADDDSRVLFRFPENFTKTGKTSFKATLKIMADANGGAALEYAEVEFMYNKTATTGSAGQFSVMRVSQYGHTPLRVTGLHFLTGVAAGTQMGVALTGGNRGATAFRWIRCELDVFATAFDSSSDSFNDFEVLSSTTSTECTANDVTDAIDMLTVASTVV
ncbi:MAG: phage tailspike protein [Rickettsiales bacterium]